MPSFETPEPISATIDLGTVGELLVVASDRTDTVVEVRPSDESDASDVQTAQRVRVDYTNGVLQVVGPRIRPFDFSRKSRSVDVTVELPSGSHVTADVQLGDVRGAGRLGRCRIKTSAGHVRLEETGPLHLDSGAGHLTVTAVAGNAEFHTGSGKVGVGRVEGTAVVKNSNGDIVIESAGGDVRARTANGGITVDRAGAGVEAKTANGDIRLGEVARGSVTLETAMGDLDIGIAEGTAAWLEVETGFGRVRNLLNDTTRPADAAETVEVRARTTYGDVSIRRS